ncbi:cubilin-like [Saccoglossus kowalevskii]|uniref:Low-density lipoprotein receptor-related protein 12-like n=1 Tax=Saccoglossus kowalevskii TaxID=10224 RepID=A0ABM0MA27_SACKO|nr:PREDICTED: low-density lipoprotein receptor-related protein 12-like [Saccoglossus kowalevskii]
MADIFLLLSRCHRDSMPVLVVLLIAVIRCFCVSSGTPTTLYTSLPPELDSQVDPACNKRYSALSGEVTSPNYPGLYPANSNCQYTILVPLGSAIWLQFTTVKLEDSYDCQADSIQVYTRDSFGEAGDTLVSTLCGFYDSSVPSITLNGSDVFIRFNSDAIGSANGFHAMYNIFNAVELENKQRKTYSICDDTMAMALSGAILSHPGYPSKLYLPDVVCRLVIAPGAGRFTGVYVIVYDVNLKVFPGHVCSSPSERIAVSSVAASLFERVICQNEDPRAHVSTDSSISLTFHTTSHDNYDYRGFKIIFTQYYPSQVTDQNTSPCHVDDFYCKGMYRCIPGFLACDGVDHCGNYDDEKDCLPGFKIPLPEVLCNPDEHYCGEYVGDSARCIHKNKICDGKVHCINGTDEFSCSAQSNSKSGGLSARAMLGVVIGLLQVVIVAAVVTRWMHGRRLKKSRNKVLRNTGCTEEELERL